VFIDLRKYPFLMDLEKALSTRYPGLRIEDVLKSRDSIPYSRSLYLLKHIVAGAQIVESSDSVEDEVLTFYSLLIGARALGETRLIHRLAVSYSKYASQNLSKEPIEALIYIARRLGIEAHTTSEYPKIPIEARGKGRVVYLAKPIALDIKQYIRLVTRRLSREPKYMLVNQIVDGGYVYLDRDSFSRILEEAIYNYIVELGSRVECHIDEITEFINEYRQVLEEAGWFKPGAKIEGQGILEAGGETTTYNPEALPPCMSKLIERLNSGENLSHHERFAVAAFLANVGLDPDSILEFFRRAPDFNEKIARYQIEHISGLRGSRKKYLPYNCDKMKSLAMCPLLDSYCEGGKNPLAVYKRNLKLLKKSAEGR